MFLEVEKKRKKSDLNNKKFAHSELKKKKQCSEKIQQPVLMELC